MTLKLVKLANKCFYLSSEQITIIMTDYLLQKKTQIALFCHKIFMLNLFYYDWKKLYLSWLAIKF